MRRFRAGPWAFLVLVLVLAASPVAAAEPAPPERGVAAETLFEEGRRLLEEGRVAEACVKLAESQKLDPSAGTLLNLADCYEKQGKTASAWGTFKEAARASEDRKKTDWERLALRRANALVPRLSRLTVSVPAGEGRAGMTVEVGTLPLAPASFDTPIPLDPGTHVVVARAPGRQTFRAEIRLGGDADQRTVVIPALALAPEAQALPAPETPAPATRVPTGTWILGAASLVLGGTGAVFWGLGSQSRSDLVGSCGQTSSCAHDDIVASRNELVVGDVLVGAAIVALGAAVYVYVVSPRPHASNASFPIAF